MFSLFSSRITLRRPVRTLDIYGLVFMFSALLFPHLDRVPFLLSVFFFLILAWRILIALGKIGYPKSYQKVAAVVVTSLSCFYLFRSGVNINSAAVFFMLAIALKLLEVKSKNDAANYIILNFYFCATLFLFEQGILWVMYQFVVLAGMFYLLARINQLNATVSGASRKRTQIKSVFKISLFTIPVMLVMFFLFPRVAPLWSVPLKTGEARTGLSSSMAPGSIASLAQSDEKVFRVNFEGEPPPRSEWYWRGLIMDTFNGRRWFTTEFDRTPVLGKLIDVKLFDNVSPEAYTVVMEVSGNQWAFGLDDPVVASNNITIDRHGLVRFYQPVYQPTIYRLDRAGAKQGEDPQRGRVRQDVLSLSDRDYQRYTQTTRLGNPKTREWVAELQKTYEDPDALLQAVLQMFQRDNFFYSLNPPLLSEDFVDDFLFNSRKGFCAHYAGSFAYLARLAGVPARVVAGYQGGEWNESGEYITVHQFDAHAWVELWREGVGWQRVDPTAYVSPSRIESGLQEAVREEGSFLQDNLFSPARYNDFQLVRWVRWQLDSLNYQWQKWIVGYNADVQEGLLPAWMKKDIVFALVATMTGLITLFALAFTGWSWYQRNRHHYPVMVRLYLRFIRSCQSVGIDYSGHEGPLDFSRKVKATLPEQTELVDRITQDYIRYTFSPEAGQILSRQQEVKAFKDKVSRFSQSVYGKRLKKFGVKRL